ncbi:MAG: flagellar basal body P-ring protein FlgI, partial [Betaproteobacteria bacterium]|nr:flagellar basal body P-ring protein FlgI [Betaproteobacteria bacterium]
VVSGAGAAQGGSKVQINHLSAGRVPNGATVERAVSSPFGNNEMIRLELQSTDFSNTQRVADAINAAFGQALATATDGRGIEIAGPATAADRVAFLAKLENIEVEKGVPPARIIINARTGSVVMNQSVSIERCAVAHGNLSVSISSTPVVSQPGPLSQGQTVVTEKADIQVKQEGGNLITLEAGAKLADVVKALNALGATPQDLVAILQAMKSSGSLRAELEVI